MESELQARDRIGVQDFVLLEDFQSEDAFLENLKKRYDSGLIYVSTRNTWSLLTTHSVSSNFNFRQTPVHTGSYITFKQ